MSDGSKLTRRTLAVAAAAAAASAALLCADDASAQRLPHAPRAKGPLVWQGMDQQELDDAYDQEVYAPNHEVINARRDANNARVLGILGKPERIAYGAAAIEGLDLYRTRAAAAPAAIFFHGGAWRGGRSAQAAYLAEPFVRAGAHFLAVDFNNVLESGGSLFPMVEQCRRAVAFVYRNAARLGADPDRLYLIGHSSGAHLGGCVVTSDWTGQDLPHDILKGALLGSGMYDLKAVRLSKRSDYVKFTDEMEQALSAQRHIDQLATPLVLTYGTLETPEFQRQTREFYAAVKAAGKPVQLVTCESYNHYETQETLGNPYGVMGRAALQMMRLA
jgi:arylformamidase